MNKGSSPLVFWILAALFLAVGLYLIWYSRRRKKMLETFAHMHQLRIRPEDEREIQKRLDSCFSLKDKGMVRSFGQLSSLVGGEYVWIFRAVELLDLNPHAKAYSTNFARIAALFEISAAHEEFFLLDKALRVNKRLPGTISPDPEVVELTKRTATSCGARHPLSVTLTGGHGLIYFEPLVTGGETLDDVNALYCMAKEMRAKLATGK